MMISVGLAGKAAVVRLVSSEVRVSASWKLAAPAFSMPPVVE